MRFCRSCYAVLADDEEICKACKTRQPERKPAGEAVLEEPTQRPRSTQLSAPEEKPAMQSIADTHSDDIRVRPSVTSTTTKAHNGNRQILPIITLTGLVVFASYILWQYAVNTEVITDISRQTLDETFRMLILSELRAHPTEYYSIADRFFRQVYTSAGPSFSNDFPLIFYIWLLAPTIGDIKWLYLPFALVGSIASYFAIFAATRQRLVAVLSAAWMAYFLETPYFLTYEYWAISIFLIGLAFFFRKDNFPAVIAIGVATLLREIFAPFLLFASVYYLVVCRQDWFHIIGIKKSRIMRPLTNHVKKTREEAFVWIMATAVVGFLLYLNAFVSTGGKTSGVGGVHNVAGFNPALFALLFSGTHIRNPLTLGSLEGAGGDTIVLLPPVVAISLALIGIAFLSKDQSIIMYASFAFLPLLIPFGIIGIHGKIATEANLPERWIMMSITFVNLFWLTGLYRIYEYAYRVMQHLLPLRKRQRKLSPNLHSV